MNVRGAIPGDSAATEKETMFSDDHEMAPVGAANVDIESCGGEDISEKYGGAMKEMYDAREGIDGVQYFTAMVKMLHTPSGCCVNGGSKWVTKMLHLRGHRMTLFDNRFDPLPDWFVDMSSPATKFDLETTQDPPSDHPAGLTLRLPNASIQFGFLNEESRARWCHRMDESRGLTQVEEESLWIRTWRLTRAEHPIIGIFASKEGDPYSKLERLVALVISLLLTFGIATLLNQAGEIDAFRCDYWNDVYDSCESAATLLGSKADDYCSAVEDPFYSVGFSQTVSGKSFGSTSTQTLDTFYRFPNASSALSAAGEDTVEFEEEFELAYFGNEDAQVHCIKVFDSSATFLNYTVVIEDSDTYATANITFLDSYKPANGTLYTDSFYLSANTGLSPAALNTDLICAAPDSSACKSPTSPIVQSILVFLIVFIITYPVKPLLMWTGTGTGASEAVKKKIVKGVIGTVGLIALGVSLSALSQMPESSRVNTVTAFLIAFAISQLRTLPTMVIKLIMKERKMKKEAAEISGTA